MPSFDIIKTSNPEKTYRVSSVLSAFDLDIDKVKEHFKGSIDIENKEWNVGLIVGSSGTGKSTIAKEVFPESYIFEQNYNSISVIDDMPKEKSIQEITKTFASVGFASPPSWLKPYSVLSNGEKMRCDLAKSILDEKELIVFDEFTSVVNREVAKTGSFAIQKAVRKLHKKFIAVTCHSDITEWLLPDWIFNTDNMTFQYFEGQKKNPEFNIEIRKSSSWNETKQVWNFFKKYHYLTSDINQNVTAYFLYLNNNLSAFIAVMTFPHEKIKNYIKISRLVVLPDFQGLGLSHIISEYVGDELKKNNKILIGGTSHPVVINYRKNSKKWICFKFGRGGKSSKANSNYKSKIITPLTGKNSKNQTKNRLSTSWKYIG